MTRTIQLAPGIDATFADDVSESRIAALRHVALAGHHEQQHGYMSGDPLEIKDGVDYENRAVKCAYCGATMPNAPWPTNSDKFTHRPRCGKCGSMMTYPIQPRVCAENHRPD